MFLRGGEWILICPNYLDHPKAKRLPGGWFVKQLKALRKELAKPAVRVVKPWPTWHPMFQSFKDGDGI
jgi:hypothetical protein